jgi:PilZ domain
MRKLGENRKIQSSGNRRTDERLPVEWMGQLTLVDDRSFACKVLDVSLAGVQVESDAEVEIGDELVLSIPTVGAFAGTVRWLTEQRIGLSLEAGPDLLLKRVAEDRDKYPDLPPKAQR